MKLLLVEDSRSVAAFLEQILRREPDIELLPQVTDGRDAVAAVRRWNPQLVLMDLVLPGMDGVDAIAEIMATAPCPIVVLSGQLDTPGRDRTFESLRAGAVDVLAKPTAGGLDAVKEFRERLLRTVRVMAHARVVGRRRTPPSIPVTQVARPVSSLSEGKSCALLAIGGSTGAPPLVYELLRALPSPAPFPVVVAQHIIRGFEPSFARWLGGTGHRTVVAMGGEWLGPGSVFVSPADRDLVVRGGRLQTQPARGVAVPSVDALFESVAGFHGSRAVGLLLTGMGEDGAKGLLAMHRAGALTVAQDGASCVVDGMPGAARAMGAASQILTPSEMTALLISLARSSAPFPPSPSGRGSG
ncbi:response regulator [Archangium violaceum]|uniref:chemotaxis protein CheB n=1 Tax=Archangium violaceum TaxID=83451 RepID=UPI001951705B|nr:chemotaxis protein CheB [Archangium violaceum]QRN98093.1 response regulator [Archangium violaceum]